MLVRNTKTKTAYCCCLLVQLYRVGQKSDTSRTLHYIVREVSHLLAHPVIADRVMYVGVLELLVLIQTSQGEGFPYLLPSVGPAADPGVQAVSPQVTISHPLGGWLPLLSASPTVTSSAAEHHLSLAVTKLYCLVTKAHRCEQLAQGCYTAFAASW